MGSLEQRPCFKGSWRSRGVRAVALSLLCVLVVVLGGALPAWAGVSIQVPGTSNFRGMDCPNAVFCMAVGTVRVRDTSVGVVVPITINGNGFPVVGRVMQVPGTSELYGVSCYNFGLNCQAVGLNFAEWRNGALVHPHEGVIVNIANNVPGAPVVVAGTGILDGVTCPDAVNFTCEAVGSTEAVSVGKGVVVPSMNGVPVLNPINNRAVEVNGTKALHSVACPGAAPTICEAVGVRRDVGIVVPITTPAAGITGGVVEVARTSAINGVACLGAVLSTCGVVGRLVSGGGIGTVLANNNGNATGQLMDLSTSALYGITSPNVNTFVEVGGGGMAKVTTVAGTVEGDRAGRTLYGVACYGAAPNQTCIAAGDPFIGPGLLTVFGI